MLHIFYEKHKAEVSGYDLIGKPSSKYDFVIYYDK